MSEENVSSISIETLVTFVGAQENLIIPFLRPHLEREGQSLKKIIIFTSRVDPTYPDEIAKSADHILNNTLKYIDSYHLNLEIRVERLANIWDLKLYNEKFEGIKSKRASVNITAGPSIFSIAALLWAIKNSHIIEHSVESNNPLTGRTVVFKNINIKPYFNVLFFTDHTDSEIIDFLRKGSSTSTRIRKYLMEEKRIELTLRTIENRINRLVELGVLEMVKGRENIVFLSENILKLI